MINTKPCLLSLVSDDIPIIIGIKAGWRRYTSGRRSESIDRIIQITKPGKVGSADSISRSVMALIIQIRHYSHTFSIQALHNFHIPESASFDAPRFEL